MMAVDSKQGTTSAPTPGPAATLAGMPAVSANGAKRKRPSSLMAQSASLPSVESSLDEFIAKANETLVDPSAFNTEQKVREEDEKRKEHDALRWRATEQQMRESQAREESLRRQLDGLQGKLAEAEARAAVAGSGGSQDGIIADLKLRLTMADEKVRAAEEKAHQADAKIAKLEQDVAAAKAQAASAAASAAAAPAARDSLVGIDNDEAEQRVRVAEAKAAKAIAAAKAAAAGLTVNPADIAAIESGLVVSSFDTGPKKSPVGAMVASGVIVGALAFVAAFFIFNTKEKPATSAAGAQPAAQQAAPQAAPAAPAKPTVTPIEEPAAAEQPAKAAAEEPAAVEEPAAEEPTKAEKAAAAKAEQEAADKAAAEEAAAAKAEKAAAKKAAAEEAAAKKAAAKKTTKTTTKKTTTKSGGGLADPFGDAPAPKKKAEKKSGGIVDPF